MTNFQAWLAELFFPARCLLCQRYGSFLCPDCQSALPTALAFYCLCPVPKKITTLGKCRQCRNLPLDGLLAPLPYESQRVQKLIANFKFYPFVTKLAEPLASLILAYLSALDKNLPWADAAVVAVPPDPSRIRRRGFNPAELIARELAAHFKLPYIPQALDKIKKTRPQTELPAEQRTINLKDAFKVRRPEALTDKIIWLVDDVATTGATMNEAARVLKLAGAKSVWGITLARAVLRK